LKRGWMIFLLCASVIPGGIALTKTWAQSGPERKRANELTLAGLRPGRDTLATALKRYKAKYASDDGKGGAREWIDTCTGRFLALESDGNMVIQGITVSALGLQTGKCNNHSFDSLTMKDWVSGRGLQLGDPQDRVTELYGEPNSVGPSVKGDKELEFFYYAFDWAGADVPQVMEVYCARDTGRVVEITLAYPSL
jgi:hypothetical protein